MTSPATAATSFPFSQNIALVPSADGLNNNGGALPTSGFPGYTPIFTPISPDSIRDDASNPLATGFDTVVLNGICDISSYLSNAQFKSRLEGFVSSGHKLIIWDSECTATDYSKFAIPFQSNNPGAQGAFGTLVDAEENQLSSKNATSASYVDVGAISSQTDAVGDANVFTTFDPRWFVDLKATNASGVTGPVQTYAGLGSGLVIYSGLDKDYMGGTDFSSSAGNGVASLNRIWMLELQQPWSPDGLPHSTSVVGGKTPFKYVALGDSFSSGEGIEPFFEPKNRCHRSTLAYSTFVEQPGFPGKSIYSRAKAKESGIQWGFQACSGAETKNILTDRRYGDPLSQLALVRTKDTNNANDLPVDANTNLVTITIGGNNVNFTDVLKFCFFSSDCTREKFHGQSLAQYNRAQRDRLSGELDKVYAKIHKQAPHAGLLVLGYPQLLPATASEQNCGKLAQQTVVVGSVGKTLVTKTYGFSRTEQNYLRQAASELNQTIAARVEASGVAQFIPVDSIFAGHEICGRAGEWINAASLRAPFTRGEVLGVNDQSFHPNARGQRLGYAEAVNGYLNQLPKF